MSENCPECNNDVLILDESRGEIICKICGLVLNQRIIDPGPEWRAFNSEEVNRRTRTGPPINPMLPYNGLSTEFKPNKDSSGKTMTPKEKSKFSRLSKWQNRTKNISVYRNLRENLPYLRNLCNQLDLGPQLVGWTEFLYKKVLKAKIQVGRSNKLTMVGCLFIVACKRFPTTDLKEILQHVNDEKITEKKVYRIYGIIVRTLNLKIKTALPKDLLSYYSSKLNLSTQVTRATLELLNLIEKYPLIFIGKCPRGVLAGALYLTCLNSERRSQEEIGDRLSVTQPTIHKRTDDIRYVLEANKVMGEQKIILKAV